MRLRWTWTGCFLVLGLLFRACHFLRFPSVWHDEAALLLNVIGKNFTELLGPLFFAEAAPPLFLWLEHGVCLVLGDSATVMRLLPFLASCGSLILLTYAARRLLVPAAVPWAVLLFACSDRLLWHCCEAKPYAVDMLVSALVLALFAASQSIRLSRQLFLYALLAPILIFVSYPACFILGALLIVLLFPVARERRLPSWAAYGLLVVAVFGAFALLVLGPARAQRHPELDSCWVTHFPPWQEPWSIPKWTLFSSLDMYRYCFEPTGPVLAGLAVLGVIAAWRGKQWALLGLAALPPWLALAASFAGSYPFGGSRVEAFTAPGLALLIAAGAVPAAGWLQARVRFGNWALAAILLAPPVQGAYHVLAPWQRPDNAAAATYVLSHRAVDEVVSGNAWQDEYYYRRLGPAYRPLGAKTLPADQRQWLVVTSWPHSERERLLAGYVGGRKILDRREFSDITVVLLDAKH